MTRTSVNGHGDKLNEKSTTIATKVTNGNNRRRVNQWETYEGTYLIPDGQTIDPLHVQERRTPTHARLPATCSTTS